MNDLETRLRETTRRLRDLSLLDTASLVQSGWHDDGTNGLLETVVDDMEDALREAQRILATLERSVAVEAAFSHAIDGFSPEAEEYELNAVRSFDEIATARRLSGELMALCGRLMPQFAEAKRMLAHTRT